MRMVVTMSKEWEAARIYAFDARKRGSPQASRPSPEKRSTRGRERNGITGSITPS